MEYSSEALQQAVKLGSELLRLSGSVEKAAGALNRERVALLGNHLSFTEEGHVIGISDLHKAYLIEMAQQGVPSRREAAPARELAKNHGSVRGHEDELMQKAWKDAAYGAALMVDPETPGVESVLTRSGVSESPLGRVPKQNPDRTVSARVVQSMTCGSVMSMDPSSTTPQPRKPPRSCPAGSLVECPPSGDPPALRKEGRPSSLQVALSGAPRRPRICGKALRGGNHKSRDAFWMGGRPR